MQITNHGHHSKHIHIFFQNDYDFNIFTNNTKLNG